LLSSTHREEVVLKLHETNHQTKKNLVLPSDQTSLDYPNQNRSRDLRDLWENHE
jgi:hypothetical protein